MNFFIAIIVMLVALASAEYKVKSREDLLQYRDACIKSVGISEECLEKYKKWDFPDDDKTHDYLNCILVKFGLFDTEKGFKVEDIHTQLVGGSHADHTDGTHAKIEGCVTKANGFDVKRRAYEAALCLMKEDLHLVQRSVHAHDHDHSKH